MNRQLIFRVILASMSNRPVLQNKQYPINDNSRVSMRFNNIKWHPLQSANDELLALASRN